MAKREHQVRGDGVATGSSDGEVAARLPNTTVAATEDARRSGTVVSVSRSADHRFSKEPVASVTLIAGYGIEGDAHAGPTTRHRYLVKKDPRRPNLTQVHLLQSELFRDLGEKGFEVGPGDLGENITTQGLDLLGLPLGARLHLGPEAVVEVTGLRSPCTQIDQFCRGLLKQVIGKDEEGHVVRRTGVMSVVITGGVVRHGDTIELRLPEGERRPLGVV